MTCRSSAPLLAAAVLLSWAATLAAQDVTGGATPRLLPGLSSDTVAELIASARPDTPAPVVVWNREVVVLRAAVAGRSAADRAGAAAARLTVAEEELTRVTVTSRPVGEAFVLSAGDRDVFALVPADADELAGESLVAKTERAVRRLQLALDERLEARQPSAMFWAVVQSAVATVLFAVGLISAGRVSRRASQALERSAERRAAGHVVADELMRATRLAVFVRRFVGLLVFAACAAAGYIWLTFTLRRFPYTRPWGESLRAYLIGRLQWLAESFVAAIPDLFTVALIFVIGRLVVRVVQALFVMIEQNRIELPGFHPDTAQTTRKLTVGLVWALVLVVSYPYIPGSGTDAFKGLSVIVAVMVSLGSSGIANQIMSGFTLTYSRALRRGDFVRVGDVEGTVTYTGLLSTKIDSPRREEVTIPNAVLISQVVTNYSRSSVATAIYVPTEVTIGYDTPWRQVQAMLLDAARRTAGIRADPPPVVRQSGLEDFGVRYTLQVCLDDPCQRPVVLSELHGHIQDAFNEQGVQIMTPAYEGDPETPKVVPKERWFPPREPTASSSIDS